MKNILDRLEYYMKIRGLNNNEITVQAGLSIGLIGKAFKNRKGLHSDSIEKILHTYNDLNGHWLITGDGSMLKESNIVDVKNEVPVAAPASNDVVNLLKEQLKEKDQKIEALSEEIGKLRKEITFLTSESSAITAQNREVKHNINTMP